MKLSVLFGIVCHYFKYKENRYGEQAITNCAFVPARVYLTGGDTHILCVACLGEEHDCEHCEVLPLRTLRSRLAFFHKEDAQARIPQDSGPAAAEAQWRLQSWGSQMDLSAGLETGTALSLPSRDRPSSSYHHLSWHINCLEMLAVFLALKNFLAGLRGHHVLVRSDNTSVVSYLNHQGGLRSRPLCKLACQILLWSQGK